MSLKLYTNANNLQAAKCLIAARYAGKTVEVPAFNYGVDAVAHPLGKVPVLETPNGPIFEANAIARYLARGTPFYGACEFGAALVDQWVDFSFNELELPLAAWLLPYTVQGVAKNDAAEKRARSDVRKALAALNAHLVTRTFLVGERVTLADVAVACGLTEAMKIVIDPGFRKEFRALNRWFATVINQPHFLAVVGEVHLCEKAPAAPKVAAAPAEAEHKKEKKEEKPKKEQPKKEEKKKEEKKKEADEEEDDTPKEEKKPNPLDALPPSKFVMDTWKRTYSNEDTKTVALPWFYENYDPEGFSLWFASYKDKLDTPHEFMAANLTGGFIQRLEGMRKYGFGSLIVFGEPGNFTINAVFLFRGKEVPADMKDCPDYESYDFRPLDLAKEKKTFEEFLTWEGDFDGKKFCQGKIYK